jgi:demethylmenaquinone methyltransferase/2-methoxy-6-polyprenyl-1,4-benzoquinol methylase
MINENKTFFGFEEIPISEKTSRVREVFQSVADNYDLMNDLMSLGAHRAWKRYAIELAQIKPGDKILDVAGGTGDLTELLSGKTKDKGCVVMSDINQDMLLNGRDKLVNKGLVSNIDYIIADAEDLPFSMYSFDCVTISFGLRNVTNKQKALESMYDSLKYGGRIIILEFSKVVLPLLSKLYETYSFSIIPMLGELISKDKASYQYLVESIRKHPGQEELKCMLADSGFSKVSYNNMSGGIVAIHKAYKI